MKFLYNPSPSVVVELPFLGLKIQPQTTHKIPFVAERLYANSSDILLLVRGGDLQVTDGTTTFADPVEGEVYLRTMFGGEALISDGGTITKYDNVLVEDPNTNKKATSIFMNMLTMMRELYNATDNPVYDASFTPILGSGGILEDHVSRIANLENIHAKHGWHTNQIRANNYTRPDDLLIYYGWINSFNSAVNQWTNEKVAQDMARYDLLVFGDGIQDPVHGDYANTTTVIPRIKALKPTVKIFGYVSVNQTLADFQNKVDQWNTLGVHGILMDEAGYDFGTTTTNSRDAFNAKVDYVHGRSSSNICFVNAWNMDHIIGTANDPTYPNTTWNTSVVESNLNYNDWYLLESFAVNTAAYVGNYAPKADWVARASKANGHRSTYGINLAAVSVIDNGNASAASLFDFSFTSSTMWAHEAHGSSDTSYGASSAAVNYQARPNVIGLRDIWTLSPSVQLDASDADVYHRYVKNGKLSVDFSAAAESSTISKF